MSACFPVNWRRFPTVGAYNEKWNRNRSPHASSWRTAKSTYVMTTGKPDNPTPPPPPVLAGDDPTEVDLPVFPDVSQKSTAPETSDEPPPIPPPPPGKGMLGATKSASSFSHNSPDVTDPEEEAINWDGGEATDEPPPPPLPPEPAVEPPPPPIPANNGDEPQAPISEPSPPPVNGEANFANEPPPIPPAADGVENDFTRTAAHAGGRKRAAASATAAANVGR